MHRVTDLFPSICQFTDFDLPYALLPSLLCILPLLQKWQLKTEDSSPIVPSLENPYRNVTCSHNMNNVMAQCWFLQVFIIGSNKLALDVVKKEWPSTNNDSCIYLFNNWSIKLKKPWLDAIKCLTFVFSYSRATTVKIISDFKN